MRERILKGLTKLHARHSRMMLAVVAVLTLIFVLLATQIKVTMRWSDLLPSQDKRTIQYNRIIDEFVSATSIVLVVQGEEERIKAFAEDVVPRVKAAVDSKDNKLYVKRVDYKQEVDFIKRHGLLLIKADDLKNMKDVFTNPNLVPLLENINDSLEKEYVGREESLSTREKEDRAFIFLDGIQNLVTAMLWYAANSSVTESHPRNPRMSAQQAADSLLIGEPYFLSYDKTSLIINVIPNFTMWEMDKVISSVDTVQDIVDELLLEYPDLQAGLTGFLPVAHDEMVYSERSISYTTLIALIAVFFLLVVSFRMWVAPLLALLNLIVGIIWAVGLAAILVGTLNIMTYKRCLPGFEHQQFARHERTRNCHRWRPAGDTGCHFSFSSRSSSFA